MNRRQDDDLAEIKLGRSAPDEAGKAAKVVGPREVHASNLLIRSFTGLLGLGREDRHERVVE